MSATERPARTDVSPIVGALVLALPVVMAALFSVWVHARSVRLGYALSEAGEAHQRLLEENRGLRIEVASLKAPRRLEELGKSYGLGPPRPEQVVRLGGDR